LSTEGWYLLLLAVIPALVPRFKCVNSNHEYVKVWCVPFATPVLYIHQIQNKVLDIRVCHFISWNFSVLLGWLNQGVSRQGIFRIWGGWVGITTLLGAPFN
jgi:hypothetical protein